MLEFHLEKCVQTYEYVFISVSYHHASVIRPHLLSLTVCCSFIRLCRAVEVKRKAVQRIEEQLMKLQVQATDREENKQIALGTSKLNYLDPRISVAW